MNVPTFPGATSVSHLQVYDWLADDGCHGGSPHLHTVSSEAYVVTGGRGEVHTLSSEGAARDELVAGSVLWFSPGTVHRLVNHDRLELVVVMQNMGLPEAGDAVLTFPDEVLADPGAYARAAVLPGDVTDAERAVAARARRDLAVTGYRELLAAVEAEGPAALVRLHRRAAALVRDRIGDWQRLWADGVEAETERTRAQLRALAEGDASHLARSTVVRTTDNGPGRGYGMCGRLRTWRPTPPG